MSNNIRPPAVAGMFYPADPEELRRYVQAVLAQAKSDVPALPGV
jgi:AmmeMemoRadiSam system protein B